MTTTTPRIEYSVVVPVYNEAENVAELHRRLRTTMDALGREYELVFVDDGSRDGSGDLLRALATDGRTVVIELARNYGQHPAVLHAFAEVRGAVVITLDADLQNPPEEIPKVLDAITRGHDTVGGRREERRDILPRRLASRLANRLVSWALRRKIRDIGCMLRGYRRELVDQMCAMATRSSYVPALAITLAENPTEVPVRHEARRHGRSKYSFLTLGGLAIDVVAAHSPILYRWTAALGVLIAFVSAVAAVVALVMGAWGPLVRAGIYFVLGILVLMAGLLGDLMWKTRIDLRPRTPCTVRRVTGR